MIKINNLPLPDYTSTSEVRQQKDLKVRSNNASSIFNEEKQKAEEKSSKFFRFEFWPEPKVKTLSAKKISRELQSLVQTMNLIWLQRFMGFLSYNQDISNFQKQSIFEIVESEERITPNQTTHESEEDGIHPTMTSEFAEKQIKQGHEKFSDDYPVFDEKSTSTSRPSLVFPESKQGKPQTELLQELFSYIDELGIIDLSSSELESIGREMEINYWEKCFSRALGNFSSSRLDENFQLSKKDPSLLLVTIYDDLWKIADILESNELNLSVEELHFLKEEVELVFAHLKQLIYDESLQNKVYGEKGINISENKTKQLSLLTKEQVETKKKVETSELFDPFFNFFFTKLQSREDLKKSFFILGNLHLNGLNLDNKVLDSYTQTILRPYLLSKSLIESKLGFDRLFNEPKLIENMLSSEEVIKTINDKQLKELIQYEKSSDWIYDLIDLLEEDSDYTNFTRETISLNFYSRSKVAWFVQSRLQLREFLEKQFFNCPTLII